MTRDEAEANLEAAIAEYSRAIGNGSDGDVITGWAVVASFTSAGMMETGAAGYLRASPTGQTFHNTLGLITYYQVMLNRSVLVDEDD